MLLHFRACRQFYFIALRAKVCVFKKQSNSVIAIEKTLSDRENEYCRYIRICVTLRAVDDSQAYNQEGRTYRQSLARYVGINASFSVQKLDAFTLQSIEV